MRCRYCYYLENERLYPAGESFRMPHDLLETYLVQHMDAWILGTSAGEGWLP
jgi:sulfatase maturation enzyme AslB (radical SAM superfamily)